MPITLNENELAALDNLDPIEDHNIQPAEGLHLASIEDVTVKNNGALMIRFEISDNQRAGRSSTISAQSTFAPSSKVSLRSGPRSAFGTS